MKSKNSTILIDVGLRWKVLIERLQQINIDISDIDAIFITHEHKDHIEGLKTMINKIDIPIVANAGTAKGIYRDLEIVPRFKIFTTDESFVFQDLHVHPFSIQHDTLEPVGFVIKVDHFKIGICSDLGFVTSLVKKNLEKCHLLYVEANYDKQMLLASNRPETLKKRILGRQGHLSNQECGDLVEAIIHQDLQHIYLSHLSSECNHQKVALKVIEKILQKYQSKAKVSIAEQERVSEKIYFS